MRKPFASLASLAPAALAVLAACSGSGRTSAFQNPPGAAGGDGPSFSGNDDGGTFASADGGAAPSGVCAPDPANYEIPGNGCDDDANGQVDDVASCDDGLDAAGDAAAFARALGLCQTAGENDTKWGVVSATFTNGHSSSSAGKGNFDAQHGILAKFGDVVTPREGARIGVLSSGSATEEDTDKGPAFKGTKRGMQGSAGGGLFGGGTGNGGDAPPGYPKSTSDCPAPVNTVNDVIDVKLRIRVPKNAKGLAFDFDFWSGEWPEFVCSTFNDAFVAYLSSAAFNGGQPDNISFDAKGNGVSVNSGFFDRCTPGTQTGCAGGGGLGGLGGLGGGGGGGAGGATTSTSACPGGEGELAGTGFLDMGTYCDKPSTGGGATGWLTSQAPVQPGEVISLELLIWDTGDESYDSSVLLDNFKWIPSPVQTGTTRPPPK